MRDAPFSLTATLPDSSYLSHPVTADSLLTVIERLSVLPLAGATWTVEQS